MALKIRLLFPFVFRLQRSGATHPAQEFQMVPELMPQYSAQDISGFVGDSGTADLTKVSQLI